jgi:hypothetical protein
LESPGRTVLVLDDRGWITEGLSHAIKQRAGVG